MKQTMTTCDIVNVLLADDNADWTPKGARALAEELEGYEEDLGEDMEFVQVAIRCDWNEDTAEELIASYGKEGQTLEEVIQRVNDNTLLIEVDNEPPTYLSIRPCWR